jgi:hypothetical protein
MENAANRRKAISILVVFGAIMMLMAMWNTSGSEPL